MSNRLSKKPATYSRKQLNERMGEITRELEKKIRSDANEQMFQMVMTISLHVLGEKYGFSQEECMRYMSLVDEQYGRIIETPYAYDDIVQEVKEICAVEIFPGDDGKWWKTTKKKAAVL